MKRMEPACLANEEGALPSILASPMKLTCTSERFLKQLACWADLSRGLAPLPGVSLVHPVDGNQVFAALPEPVVSGLRAEGYMFYGWDAGGISTVRLVTAFNTREEDVDSFIATAGRFSA